VAPFDTLVERSHNLPERNVSETPKQDSRSVSELFSTATDWTLDDGWGAWPAVWALHSLGTSEVLARALELVASDDPRLRERALDILGQLGVPTRTFPDECFRAAVERLNNDPDSGVLVSAAIVLGHLKDPRGIDALVGRLNHSDADVRHAVASALGGNSDSKSIAALMQLMTDEDAHVRDWATFGIGELGKLDTPEIREALYRRLDDVDEETRYEAMRGLARCGDLRVARPLIDALKANPENFDLWDPASTLLKLDDEHEEFSADALIERIQSLISK
jgi:HEAT repeat protein